MATIETFKPNAPSYWNGLNAGHIGFAKVLEEFLDNSDSAGADKIHIQIRRENADRLSLTVHDNGSGISVADLPRVFGIGYAPEAGKAGLHNQFGVGLKSALASCDPANSDWDLYTRTTSVGEAVCVTPPYDPAGMRYRWAPMPRPQGWEQEPGTCVNTPLSHTLFATCLFRSVNDDERIAALVEELQVTYAPRLANKEVTLEWIPQGGKPQTIPLEPLWPQWAQGAVEKTQEVDLGGGKVKAHFIYGGIIPNKKGCHYFMGNITSSGLMVYLNGRLIQDNLFFQVWKQPHPNCNKFLFLLDLQTVDGNRDALPTPTPDKTFMVLGDPKFAAMAEWVHKVCPAPEKTLPVNERSELAKCRDLAKRLKESGQAQTVLLELPFKVDDRHPNAVRADVYAMMTDGRSVLYEAKTGTSLISHMVQLGNYCMMAAEEGLRLDEIVLVAKHHPSKVLAYAGRLARRWYRDLPVPAIRCLTWKQVEAGKF